MNKVVDDISASLSMEDEPDVYRDPADPTKFFQQGNQNQQDMINFAMIMIALYAVYQGFSSVITL